MIAPAALETVISHCRRELPHEACGILGGRDGRVESVHPVQSTPPGRTRFAMDPAAQLCAMDNIQREGRVMVGIYHSHPEGPAVPSRVDLEQACWPGTTSPNYPEAVQVIVSLQDRDAPVVKGYTLAAGAYVEVPIVVGKREKD